MKGRRWGQNENYFTCFSNEGMFLKNNAVLGRMTQPSAVASDCSSALSEDHKNAILESETVTEDFDWL